MEWDLFEYAQGYYAFGDQFLPAQDVSVDFNLGPPFGMGNPTSMDDLLGWLEGATHNPDGFGRGLADWMDGFAVWMFGNDLLDMDGDGDRDMTDAGLAMQAVANQALQDMNNPGGVVSFGRHVMDAVAFGYYGAYFRHVGGIIDQVQGD